MWIVPYVYSPNFSKLQIMHAFLLGVENNINWIKFTKKKKYIVVIFICTFKLDKRFRFIKTRSAFNEVGNWMNICLTVNASDLTLSHKGIHTYIHIHIWVYVPQNPDTPATPGKSNCLNTCSQCCNPWQLSPKTAFNAYT